jgi:glutamate synthase (NADPH/NADH) large chain/glutamate synthase (ferredoxin)
VFDDECVVEKGRLAPGEMIAVDTLEKRLLRSDEIRLKLARQQPYGEWVKKNLIKLQEHVTPSFTAEPVDVLTLTQRQLTFGYSSEEVEMILKPMVATGAEAVGSMGDDTPLAVLSIQPRLLYTYFKQLFAQVTNPPIDPIREKLVMSVHVTLGWRRNLLGESAEHARLIQSESPILLDYEVAFLRDMAALDHPSCHHRLHLASFRG